jgi:DNA-binding GntR family transcriptional regulator
MSESKKSLTQTMRAVESMRSLIHHGELTAGSNHLEVELAAMLDMSRTPVREAALVLEAEGLVEMRPRKGVRIKPVTMDDLEEIFKLLILLESIVVETIANRKPEEKELHRLTDIIDDMDRALGDKETEVWATADLAFHTELLQLGGQCRVSRYVSMLTSQLRRAHLLTLSMSPLPLQSNNDHKTLVDALRAGDGALARQIHSQHLTADKHRVMGILQRLGLKHI